MFIQWINALNYHSRRALGNKVENPSYLNSSLFDTLSGILKEVFIRKPIIFISLIFGNGMRENTDEVLSSYNWEFAKDTSTSWRIGDVTQSFANYGTYVSCWFYHKRHI